MNELLTLTKQCLSIISTATLKDAEIEMWINAGIEDITRQGIEADISNELVKAAIVMFVKANFGNVDIKEKELAQKTYSLLCCNLGLSLAYREVEENA